MHIRFLPVILALLLLSSVLRAQSIGDSTGRSPTEITDPAERQRVLEHLAGPYYSLPRHGFVEAKCDVGYEVLDMETRLPFGNAAGRKRAMAAIGSLGSTFRFHVMGKPVVEGKVMEMIRTGDRRLDSLATIAHGSLDGLVNLAFGIWQDVATAWATLSSVTDSLNYRMSRDERGGYRIVIDPGDSSVEIGLDSLMRPTLLAGAFDGVAMRAAMEFTETPEGMLLSKLSILFPAYRATVSLAFRHEQVNALWLPAELDAKWNVGAIVGNNPVTSAHLICRFTNYQVKRRP